MNSTSVSIACTLVISLILSVFGVSCSSKPQYSPQRFDKNMGQTTNSAEKTQLIGKVVLNNNQFVPDSLACTVSYRDLRTNQKITVPVKNGEFRNNDYSFTWCLYFPRLFD